MANYVRTRLGDDALDYLLQRLRNGHSLLGLVSSVVAAGDGHVTSLLPGSVADADAKDFMRGGKVQAGPSYSFETDDGRRFRAEAIGGTEDGLVQDVNEFLQGGGSRLCVMDNASARPSSPWLQRERSRMIICDEEVYHVLGRDASPAEIELMLREAKSIAPPSVTVLSISDFDIGDILEGEMRMVGATILEDIASQSVAVLVRAYDGEGYLVWTANRPVTGR